MGGRYLRRSDKQRIAEAFRLGHLPEGLAVPPNSLLNEMLCALQVIQSDYVSQLDEKRQLHCMHIDTAVTKEIDLSNRRQNLLAMNRRRRKEQDAEQSRCRRATVNG